MNVAYRLLQAGLMISISASLTSIALADNYQPKLVKVADHQAIANNVIAKFKASNLGTQQVSALNQMGLSIQKTFTLPKKPGLSAQNSNTISLLTISDGSSVKEAITKLKASGLVVYAEPDYVLRTSQTTPNDPSFSTLWGMNNTGQTSGTADADIDATEAWDIHTGDNSVVVAVVDTGVDYNHEDLDQNMWMNPDEIPGNGIDDDGNGYIDDVYGIDCYNGDSDPMDDHYHGTHVAGTIGAEGNNGIGVAGVNWNTQIMALKFLNGSGSGSTAGAIECLAYAANMASRSSVNLKVTNNSWGGGAFSDSLLDTFNSLGDMGVLSAVAAGNDSTNIDSSPSYPAAYDAESIVSVASTTHDDEMSYFSNYGLTTVDLGAPGSDIVSTMPGNDYGSLSGTSMASPHVAGALAYLWSYNPSYTPTALKNLVMSNGDSIPALNGTTVSGKRLNLFSSLSCEPGEPRLNITQPTEGFSVTSGSQTSIQASISDCGVPVTGEQVNADFSNGESSVALLDNGSGPDLVANDGIYTGNWTPASPESNLTIEVANNGDLTDSVTGQVISNYIISDTTYDWVDATAGTEIDIRSDDTYEEVPLDFDFDFYGQTYSSIFVSSNGLITFGAGSSNYGNTELPSSGEPNNLIAAFWDDLHLGYADESRAYIHTDGVSPNRRVTISWENVKHFSQSSGGDITFQVNLYEGSNDIVVQYNDVVFDLPSYDYGASATIGVEDSTGTMGAQFSFDSVDPMLASGDTRIAIGNERAIRFSMTPGDSHTPLAINSLDRTKHGKFYFNAEPHPDGSVFYSFTSNGGDRELRLVGFDVDTNTELCIYLNSSDTSLACLDRGVNNRLTPEQRFTVPIGSQVEGVNSLEVRAARPATRWGFTKIGLFDFPKGPAALPLGESTSHRFGWDWGTLSNRRIRASYVTNISTPSEGPDGTQYFLRVRGYDIDTSSEACVYLNSISVGCIPAGGNNRLTPIWYFYLQPEQMVLGYNYIHITQRTPGDRWGVTGARVIPVVIPSALGVKVSEDNQPLSKLPGGAKLK